MSLIVYGGFRVRIILIKFACSLKNGKIMINFGVSAQVTVLSGERRKI